MSEGALPFGWKAFTLGPSCIKIGSGATPRGGASVYQDEGVALIRSQNVRNEGFDAEGLAYINDGRAAQLQGVAVQEGDVLLNITGDSVARVCQAPADVLPARVNQHVAIIRPRPEVLDAAYVRYYLVSGPMQSGLLAMAGGGATRNALTKGMIERIEIVAPSAVDDQRAISKVLRAVDDKIELNRRTSETLEGMARALFQSWFVDFDPVRAKAEGESEESICERLYLTPDLLQLFPGSLEASALGEVPAGWSVAGMSQFAGLETASTSPSAHPGEVFEHYSIPAFDAGRTPVYELGVSIKSNKYRVSPRSVLVSKLNPETPRVWLPDVRTTRAVCSTEFMQFEPHRASDRSFLYVLLQTEYVQSEIQQRVTGSTGSRQRAQPSQIAVLPVVIPPPTLIERADGVLTPLLSRVAEASAENALLSTSRDALLARLLSGDLRVSPLDA